MNDKVRPIKASYYPPKMQPHAHPRRTDWKRTGMLVLLAFLFFIAFYFTLLVVLAAGNPPV